MRDAQASGNVALVQLPGEAQLRERCHGTHLDRLAHSAQ
jgi:hypothetical protein